MRITLNGRPLEISVGLLTYEHLVLLADAHPRQTLYTVAYSGHGRPGSLLPGQSVLAEDGMIFTVVVTDNA